MGIGTIINNVIPNRRTKIVFGSGAGYRPLPSIIDNSWYFACVRGPLTARVLGLPERSSVTDGAILLGLLPEAASKAGSERSGIVFMPHVSALAAGNWREVCKDAGVEFLDPTGNSQKNVERIRCANLVIADAMHAAIVADTLRVPWVPSISSNEINSFKWVDWTLSMEVPYCPKTLPKSSSFEQIRSAMSGIMGSRHCVGDPQEDLVLKEYYRMCRRKLSNKHRIINRTASTLHRLVLKKAWRSQLLSPLRSERDKRCHENAVIALRELSKNEGYLSKETVFRRKLEEMESRLADVKTNLLRAS